eukprot:4692479-Pyramimonas_sp.AAC.1
MNILAASAPEGFSSMIRHENFVAKSTQFGARYLPPLASFSSLLSTPTAIPNDVGLCRLDTTRRRSGAARLAHTSHCHAFA